MKYFKPVYKGIKRPFKLLKIFLKQKAGWLDVPKILPYKGYGNERNVFIEGMVIEDKGLAKPKDNQRFWQNILATLKRFSSDEPDNLERLHEYFWRETNCHYRRERILFLSFLSTRKRNRITHKRLAHNTP